MGLDFSYLLYFKREQLWEALQGVAGIAEPHHPPIKIHFQDHELSIPLDSWLLKEKEVHHNDPEFSFATALIFEEDEAIQDYIFLIDRGYENTYRSPPGTDDGNRVSIVYIYLTVYNDLSWLYPQKKTSRRPSLIRFWNHRNAHEPAFRQFHIDPQNLC